jgi:hypothetical protein
MIISEDKLYSLYINDNLSYDKMVLFSDFTQSLFVLIFNTFMGDDVTNDDDKINHFKWCWDKNIENFKLEEIIFHTNVGAYNFFLDFILESYYDVEDKDLKEHLPIAIRTMWLTLYNLGFDKTKYEWNTLIKSYRIMDEMLKNSK